MSGTRGVRILNNGITFEYDAPDSNLGLLLAEAVKDLFRHEIMRDTNAALGLEILGKKKLDTNPAIAVSVIELPH